MYRWSTAKISDNKIMTELEDFVFKAPHKGETLKAYMKIALGDKEQGVLLLKKYIDETKIIIKKDRIPNPKA